MIFVPFQALANSTRKVCLLIAIAGLQLGIHQGADGQEFEGIAPADSGQITDTFFNSSQNSTLWISYVAGRGIGDVMSNTEIGGNHFRFMDNGVRMFSAEFQISEYGDPNLSLGLQRRFWIDDLMAFGVGFNFDAMNSYHGNTYQQTGINLEWFCDDWTIRSNVTLPVGPQTRNIAFNQTTLNSQPMFQGNGIGFRRTTFSLDETSMRGVDVEIARSIQKHPGEVYVGYYNLNGKIGPVADGIKGGFRGNFTPRLAGNISIADDAVFGTNVFGGLTFFFHGLGRVAPRTVQDKMTMPVIRNQQVVINEVETEEVDQFDQLTNMGQAITFNHVNSSGIFGDGTFENPFGSLAAADTDPNKNNRDIAYVHSGSTFNNQSYRVASNQRLLGEGDNNLQTIQTDQLGLIALPQGNGAGNSRPVITGAATGIFANSGSQISNFRIQNTNTAILANNATGTANVNRTVITGGATGINIVGGTAAFTFDDVDISNQTVTGFNVVGGTSRSTFDAASSVAQSAGGDAVRVSGVHNGQVAFDAGSSIGSTDGDGLQFNDADGNYDFRGSVQLNGGNAGIDILGGSAGTFTFTDTTITNPTGIALSIENSDANVTHSGGSINQANDFAAVNVNNQTAGSINLGVDINATNGTGLQFNNADGIYNFNSMTGTTTLNGGDAGIDILGDSAGTFTFSNTNITDPTGTGLNVDGGSADVNFNGASSIVKSNVGSALNVQGEHTGTIIFDTGTTTTATNGDGLQFDNADGQYDFRGQVQLNGGDAGIDILGGSAGTFTFTDTTIANPTDIGLNVEDSNAAITYSGGSINQANDFAAINVSNHAAGAINVGVDINATNGTGLQFNNADSTYNFNSMTGATTLNGGDAGIDIIGGSAGTFTFTNTTITDPTGTGLNVEGGSANVLFTGPSSIAQSNTGSVLNVQGGHAGTITFDTGTTITATDGDGLQFNNADGVYNFLGTTTLNGGDAGIDIIGGSGGTFTFNDTTTITNPTGVAFNVEDLVLGGTINFKGSIEANNEVFLSIDTTAAGSSINFNTNGANSLTSTGNPNGAIFIFDADGDITITTPVTVIDPEFSAFFATDGDGTWSFTDMTITGQSGLNGGIDLFGQMGTVNFTNLNITTNSAGTGDATTGFLAGGNNIINVFGADNNINADGGGAIVLINVAEINMTFNDVTSTNNSNTQIGFAGDDGIDLLNVDAGTLDITGSTKIHNADGVGISIEGTGATATFNTVDIDTIGLDAIISGVALDNPGIVNVNGGTVNNVTQRGFRIGSGNFGSGVLGGFNLNNTTFTNIGGEVGQVSNSVLSGSGNIAVPFSATDLGGNTGSISFNGGANIIP